MLLSIERAFVKYPDACEAVIDLKTQVTIPAGVHALTGHSGAGKSTLLRLIAGWFNRNQDAISCESNISATMSEVIYLSKDTLLLPWHTVWRNIEIISASYGKKAKRTLVEEWLKVAELEISILDLHPQDLSSGMAARCDLVCAISSEAPIILIDESLALIQSQLRSKIIRYLSNLPDRVILIATHNEDLINQVDFVFNLDSDSTVHTELLVKRNHQQ